MEGNSLLRNILASCFSMFQDVENIPNFWLLFKPYFQNMGEEYPCLVWKYIENESAKKENKIEVYMHSPPHQLLICEKARNPEKLRLHLSYLMLCCGCNKKWIQHKYLHIFGGKGLRLYHILI